MKEKKSLDWLVPFIFLALMIGTAFVQGRVGQPWGGIAAFFTMGGYLLYMLVIRKKREKARQEEEPVRVSKTAPKTEQQTQDTSWQSKNFLDIDDDMEFEFLDLK